MGRERGSPWSVVGRFSQRRTRANELLDETQVRGTRTRRSAWRARLRAGGLFSLALPTHLPGFCPGGGTRLGGRVGLWLFCAGLPGARGPTLSSERPRLGNCSTSLGRAGSGLAAARRSISRRSIPDGGIPRHGLRRGGSLPPAPGHGAQVRPLARSRLRRAPRSLLSDHFLRNVLRPHHSPALLADERVDGRPGHGAEVLATIEAERAGNSLVVHFQIRNCDGHVQADLQYQLGLARELRGHQHAFSTRVEMNEKRSSLEQLDGNGLLRRQHWHIADP